MTKIKDLAIVAVESAFTLFPVSTERYELGRAIFLTSRGDFSSSLDAGLISGDWRVNLWVRERRALFYRAALDFNWSQSARLRHHLSKLSLDRARRCEATLRFWLTDVRWDRMRVAAPEVLESYLWQALVSACHDTGDIILLSSTNGQEVST